MTPGSRARDPDETFHAYRHLMPAAGITRLADVTGLDVVGVPVFLGIRPLARSLVISVGKGADVGSARTGALMEGIECWYAEFVRPDLCQMTAHDLAGSCVDPAMLPGALDAIAGEFSGVRADWLRGADVRTGEPVWVPFDVVSLDYRCSQLSTPWLARSSNGLASGNTRDEAVLHAICEVVESDAEWRWRTSDDSRRLDLSTVTDPVCVAVVERIHRAGLYVAAWDVTSGVGVPCFGCVVLADPSRGIPGDGVHDGFACHPSPGRALAGALLEAVQKRLTYISGSRDDVTRTELARATSAGLARDVWEECHAEPETVPFVGGVTVGADAGSQLRAVLDALDRAGFPDPVAVDLPDPSGSGDGPAVVKVVIPGMYGPYAASSAPEVAITPHRAALWDAGASG